MNAFAAALVLLAQATPSAPASVDTSKVDPKVAEQVPLIAGKLREWQGGWGAVKGQIACRTVKSTGDEEIDMIGCGALIACLKPAYPAMKAIADGPGTEAEKKAKIGEAFVALQPCMSERRGVGIAALALKRGGA